MVPPTIAPTLGPSSSSWGASNSWSVDIAVGSEVVLLSSLAVVLLVVLSVDDLSVVLDVLLVPIVVGSDKVDASAVRSTDILVISTASRSDALATTVAAMSDEDPQPYWK
jgi:hypothetical protein